MHFATDHPDSKIGQIFADKHNMITLVQIKDGLTAGDVRVTIQPTLASIQTLFLKYLTSFFVTS